MVSGLLKELQESIISSYYDYKGALNKLKDTRAKIVLYNKNYAEAVKKLNEEVLALMEKYPNLETHWENGHLIIDNEQEALDEAEKTVNERENLLRSTKII